MPVFFVHDVNHGIVKPLDRKFRIREIDPVQEVTKSLAIHSKTITDLSDLPYVQSKHSFADDHSDQEVEASKKALRLYEENSSPNERLSLGKVKDIMSHPVITVFDDQSLSAAWRIMQSHNIHHLAILDSNYQYRGLLSDEQVTPCLLRHIEQPDKMPAPDKLLLTHFCYHDMLSTHPETELYDLGVAMMEYGLDAIAVSDQHKIIGLVTKTDVLKVLLKHQTLKVSV